MRQRVCVRCRCLGASDFGADLGGAAAALVACNFDATPSTNVKDLESQTRGSTSRTSLWQRTRLRR